MNFDLTSKKFSIVIPAFNEANRISKTLKDIHTYIIQHQISAEVIVVNDGSSDDTAATVEATADLYREVKLVTYQPNKGKGYALRRGLAQAKGDIVMYMDADNATRVSEIEHALTYLTDQTLVIGSRYMNQSKVVRRQSLARWLISRFGNLMIRLVTGLNISDTQCGFKIFTAKQTKLILPYLSINRFGLDIELLVAAKALGLNIHEMPVTWTDVPESRVHPIWGTLNTLRELLVIQTKKLRGAYKPRT